MKTVSALFLCVAFGICQAQVNSKIKVYFNHPVNASVATFAKAVYLNKTIDDTLIAYINRAKYSLDIAVYNFDYATSISYIAGSVNNAHKRGVKVRWIYDGSSSNSGLKDLDTAIKRIGSPTSSSYGIMHNKFMVIDAHSADSSDPLVWTGSTNWTAEQINSDYNNVIIFQDKALALAYTTEFNEMWGDTGLSPNLSTSKFGPKKSNNTPHNFVIGGSPVQMYFSPTDGAPHKLRTVINRADSVLMFGIYAFTEDATADSILKRLNSGVKVYGIMDAFSKTYDPYSSILSSAMGANLKLYTGSYIYHSKVALADPNNLSSDPTVETGSYNWSSSADNYNDENMVIVHDPAVANLYYQALYQDFTGMGGVIEKDTTLTGLNDTYVSDQISLYPNPATSQVFIKIDVPEQQTLQICVVNLLGETLYSHEYYAGFGGNTLDAPTNNLKPGIYQVVIKGNNWGRVKSLIVTQ